MVVFEAVQYYIFNIDFLDLRSKMIDNELWRLPGGRRWSVRPPRPAARLSACGRHWKWTATTQVDANSIFAANLIFAANPIFSVNSSGRQLNICSQLHICSQPNICAEFNFKFFLAAHFQALGLTDSFMIYILQQFCRKSWEIKSLLSFVKMIKVACFDCKIQMTDIWQLTKKHQLHTTL